MRRVFWKFAGLCAALAAAAPASAAEQNASVANFYRGKTVQLVVGFSVGGGYDLNARMLARHMGKYIPGRPTLIVQNMPGAGGLRAANYLYAAAPKDGSVIGSIARTNVIAPLFGQGAFDSTKFNWLGNASGDVSVCLTWHASPIKAWDDVLRRESNFGGNGAGSDPDMSVNLYRSELAARMKLVTGFPGTRDMAHAMERGELDGFCGISWSTVKSQYGLWLRERKIHVIVQAAPAKAPDLPEVPLATELARDPARQQVLKFVTDTQALARPILAPPGIPADRKAALRAAFDLTMKDPAFVGEMIRAGLEVDPDTGAQVDAIVAAAYRTPKDVVARAARATSN